MSNLGKLGDNLLKRGCHLADITSQFNIVTALSQHDLLFCSKKGENPANKNLPLIIRHSFAREMKPYIFHIDMKLRKNQFYGYQT